MKLYNSKGSKKQILLLLLIAVVMMRKGKDARALVSLFEMQKMVSGLDETVPRNMDYILAVNTLTTYALIRIRRQDKVISFLEVSQTTLN